MNLNSQLYLILILAAFGGGMMLVMAGLTPAGENDFRDRRLYQLQKKQLTRDILEPKEQIGSVVLSDYFEKNGTAYFYLGGLWDVDWIPGDMYSGIEIEKILRGKDFTGEEKAFFSQSLGENNLYINADCGVRDPTKKFLQALDQYQKQRFDTVFVDFRFLRETDFSQLIALFNQLSPREKIDLGTVTNPYQRTELKTSGQPFFHADQYVFLVDPSVPESLRSLILIFQSRAGYEIRGAAGEVHDTVCVETEYHIGAEKYRICTDQYIRPAQKGEKGETLPDERLQEMFLRMSEYWYGRRDTQYLVTHLPGWLSQ